MHVTPFWRVKVFTQWSLLFCYNCSMLDHFIKVEPNVHSTSTMSHNMSLLSLWKGILDGIAPVFEHQHSESLWNSVNWQEVTVGFSSTNTNGRIAQHVRNGVSFLHTKHKPSYGTIRYEMASSFVKSCLGLCHQTQDANISATGDQVILVGAASKGIIQRGFQHNAMVYKTPYAKNPFDTITDEELEEYKKVVERKQKGESCRYRSS